MDIKKLLAEAIGTFMLVSAVCGAAMISFDALGGGSGITGVAFTVGLSVMAMAYAVGNDAELMQYRRPDGSGPSSNTCPR